MNQKIAFSLLLCLSLIGAMAGESRADIPCQVSCVSPFPVDLESSKVIEAVQHITKALAERDFDHLVDYMDSGCTTYDENTKRTVVGPQAIIADIKSRMAAEEQKSKAPIISYKIDRPFARVDGDTAVVCFVLIKELGGDRPITFEEHCTDVFVKRGQAWKKLNFRGAGWKRVN